MHCSEIINPRKAEEVTEFFDTLDVDTVRDSYLSPIRTASVSIMMAEDLLKKVRQDWPERWGHVDPRTFQRLCTESKRNIVNYLERRQEGSSRNNIFALPPL